MDCTEKKIFCLCFSSLRIFHLYGDFTIAGESLQMLNLTLTLSAPMAIEHWGFFSCKRHTFFWSFPRSSNSRTCCLALGSGTVTLRVVWSPERDSHTGLPISMANVITIDPPQDLFRGQWSINFDYCKIFLKSSFSKPPRSIFI